MTRRSLCRWILCAGFVLPGCDAASLLSLGTTPSAAPATTEAPLPDPFAASPAAGDAAPEVAARGTDPEAPVVIVNGETLGADTLASLSAAGIVPAAGRYWYDPACGAWGFAGFGTAGWLPAGLALGGPLSPTASGGDTGVFVNGRQLPATDVAALQRLGPVAPGRYWLDALGNWGVQGGAAQGNLVAAAQQQQAAASQGAGGGDGGFYHSDATGTTMNSSGGSGYIMGDGFSVSW
ncbi:MAG: hypothetical protein AAF721_20975 [Myxococcota bacterium]